MQGASRKQGGGKKNMVIQEDDEDEFMQFMTSKKSTKALANTE